MQQNSVSPIECGKEYARDTLVGQMVAKYYSIVDWALVDNEMLKAAKQRYDSNEELDSLRSFSYNEPAVARLVESVLIAGVTDPTLVGVTKSMVIQSPLSEIDVPTFPVNWGDTMRRKYVCILRVNHISQAVRGVHYMSGLPVLTG